MSEFKYRLTDDGAAIIMGLLKSEEGLEIQSIKDFGATRYTAIIPDTLDGHPVKGIGESAFANLLGLERIEIPDSVTSIGNEAFLLCQNLQELVLPEGVTKIGERTFLLCKRMTRITLPKGLTEIGELAFEDCVALTELVLPDNIKKIGSNAFQTRQLKRRRENKYDPKVGLLAEVLGKTGNKVSGKFDDSGMAFPVKARANTLTEQTLRKREIPYTAI